HAQVARFFDRATAFCLPSRAEPFGIVLLEAGAFRLPVVATRVGGIPEIVEDRVTGLLVPPDDAGSLADALVRVLTDSDFAASAGRGLHDRVRAVFSWRRAYDAYRALLFNPNGAIGSTSDVMSAPTI